MKKTKMVCTIGPKSEKREIMETLLNSGMNVMRLNFSHGDFEEHGGRITNINAIMQETGKVFAVLLDRVLTPQLFAIINSASRPYSSLYLQPLQPKASLANASPPLQISQLRQGVLDYK